MENKEIIHKNNTVMIKEAQTLAYKLGREKKEKSLRKEAILKEIKDAQESNKSLHESLINQLAVATDQESCNAAIEAFKSNQVNIVSSYDIAIDDFDLENDDDEWMMDQITPDPWNVLSNYLDP